MFLSVGRKLKNFKLGLKEIWISFVGIKTNVTDQPVCSLVCIEPSASSGYNKQLGIV